MFVKGETESAKSLTESMNAHNVHWGPILAAKDSKKAAAKKILDKEKEVRNKQRQALIAQGLDPAENGIPESDDEAKIDDLSIEELILKKDSNGNNPQVGGFILLGFPQTQAHA